MLRAALGQSLEATNDGVPETVEEVEVSVHLDGASLTPTVQKDLVAQFRVPAGQHVYANPAPVGSIAVDLILDDHEGLVHRAIIRPPAEPHSLAGTDETFDVYHDVFQLRLPLTVNNASQPEITIAGELIWQSCDDQVCGIPVRKRFAITLPVTASPPVALGSRKGAALEPNAMAHFAKMTERRRQD
ncbi:MAG: protein-disulfide reductase DsbD domain-containing protein [Pseudomonadales bacterium]|nr:protein-disulfide reductase DsbD domain-containing protein [Pseudomonadales bacterium]